MQGPSPGTTVLRLYTRTVSPARMACSFHHTAEAPQARRAVQLTPGSEGLTARVTAPDSSDTEKSRSESSAVCTA